MDAYLPLDDIELEFQDGDEDFEVSFEEYGILGNKEVFLCYNSCDGGHRHLLVREHKDIAQIDFQAMADLKKSAKDPDYLREVFEDPATLSFQLEDGTTSTALNADLLRNTLGMQENTVSESDTGPEEAPEHVKKGMMAAGPVEFKTK